jgi:hypothetical protein
VTNIVFDTTALSHFARAGRMEELRTAVADDEPVLLAEVAAELARGIPGYPSLGSAAAGGWLKQVELEELPELAAFARYKGQVLDLKLQSGERDSELAAARELMTQLNAAHRR